MATIAECLRRVDELRAVSETPRLDVEVLLAHCLDRDRAYLFTWPERILAEDEEQAFILAFDRRRQGEPVAHIVGYREFWSLPLQVDASTLIPRPDTELLVETALSLLPDSPQQVLDLGTGTGAIALALASERPAWKITACDNSPGAVRLAEENRARLGLTNVRVLQSDWYCSVAPLDFDLIVSNPPYIDPDDEHLDRGDLPFEPRSALVADEQGLADIRRIIDGALLNHGPCWLLFEHGWQQASRVRDLLHGAGFEAVQTWVDLAGHERATGGRKIS